MTKSCCFWSHSNLVPLYLCIIVPYCLPLKGFRYVEKGDPEVCLSPKVAESIRWSTVLFCCNTEYMHQFFHLGQESLSHTTLAGEWHRLSLTAYFMRLVQPDENCWTPAKCVWGRMHYWYGNFLIKQLWCKLKKIPSCLCHIGHIMLFLFHVVIAY